MASPVSGLFEVFHSFGIIDSLGESLPQTAPFQVEIVARDASIVTTASGLPILPHRTLEQVRETDIVIIPAMMVTRPEWEVGRYPEVVEWLRSMHTKGASLCSACSGVLLLAETGLLDGRESTIHWAFAPTFQRNFPSVRLRMDEVLIVAGEKEEFVMAGGGASWHDLALFLIARHVGPTAAQAVAKFLLLQWHKEGQAPYVSFAPTGDHGDAVVADLEKWLRRHYMVAAPVEEMARRSGLPERTFKRRFTKATGYSPIAYVQHVRIEEAKRRLERTEASVDEIGWSVGYEDASYFRRLFKRITHLKPSDYRRKFWIPALPDFTS